MIALLLLGCGVRGLCGDGTTKIDGVCVSDAPTLCGEGTRLEDGACLAEGTLPLCAPGTLEDNGFCVPDPNSALTPETLFFPFPAGTETRISQGYQTNFSHNGRAAWSVDLPTPLGTPVVAVRGGVVVDIKEDSDHGCGDESCASEGNFVRLDHGDGTLSVYLHLLLDGADVEIGELVGEGQVVGWSGNTGFSTGPHLHLSFLGTDGFTQPVRFVELAEAFGDGTPFQGAEAVSQNEPQPVEPVEPSSCNRNAFLYRGVELLNDVPCSVITIGQDYPIQARVPEGFDLAVHRFSDVQGEWLTTCMHAIDGVVDGSFRFGLNNFEARSYLQFSASTVGTDCTERASWISSPRIILTAP